MESDSPLPKQESNKRDLVDHADLPDAVPLLPK